MGGAHLIVNGDPPQCESLRGESPTSPALGHDVGQMACDLGGLVVGRRLDHDPHQRLGAARADEHPAATGEAPFGLVDLGLRPSRPGRRPPRTGTFTSTCGSRVMTEASSASDRPGALHEVEHPEAGQQAVPGRSEVVEDHMTALLAAEAEPAVVEHLEHVAVADRRLLDR